MVLWKPAGSNPQGRNRLTRKRRIDQHRADADSRAQRRRPDLILILDNIRSLTNVGAIFRAADGFGVKEIYLCCCCYGGIPSHGFGATRQRGAAPALAVAQPLHEVWHSRKPPPGVAMPHSRVQQNISDQFSGRRWLGSRGVLTKSERVRCRS